ncbi:unnamed protein product [Sphagnum compactum]
MYHLNPNFSWPSSSSSSSSSSPHQYLVQPHHHLFSVDQLSRLSTVNRDGPKLEDFLGGTSLGGQYSDSGDHQSHHHHHQQQLEGFTGLKSWLHHQADAADSKAGIVLQGVPQAARHSTSSLSSATALTSWQPLSLSMSAASSSSHAVTDHSVSKQQLMLPNSHHMAESSQAAAIVPEPRKRGVGRMGAGKDGPSPRKSIDTFGQRTSVYRGVTRHRWTGRYEAHLWDNSCRKEGQTRKGRQGGYDKEDKAARAYDLAALKYWGPSTTINFPLSTYEAELEVMKNMTRQEYVASLRRKSSGFSRGASVYRGVTRHHQHGRWQARIGRVAGNKDLYLGTYSTQEEAAEAYDIAAIKFRGVNAVTNFDMSKYDILKIHAEKIHAAALNEQHGQEISFKYKPVDQKLIKEHRDTPGSDALCVQDENHRIVTSGLPTETPGSRLELVSTHDQDHLTPILINLDDTDQQDGSDSLCSPVSSIDDLPSLFLHTTFPHKSY